MSAKPCAGSERVHVLETTCHALLGVRDEASVSLLAAHALDRYAHLSADERSEFFHVLLDRFSADPTAVDAAISEYQSDPTPLAAQHLSTAAEAPRQALFRALNVTPGGTAGILGMRADCLALRDRALQPVAYDLEHLLASWFNRGFLHLERLDQHTPTNILEKLIEYEAVHEIRGWGDLHRRLAPDRRCYGFFHPALPGEPLIFVEVALTVGLQGSIQAVLDAPEPTLPSVNHIAPADVDTALFYSITNCQPGLRGIPMGSFLLKQVTATVLAELPQINLFSTLSPVPGFADWVRSTGALDPEDPNRGEVVRACARYLTQARTSAGYPLDPVARFHLRNGARLERINWAGDSSPKGMSQSLGLLVNYVYDPDQLADNHEAYVNTGCVARSSDIDELI